jgi:hypothetical protein
MKDCPFICDLCYEDEAEKIFTIVKIVLLKHSQDQLPNIELKFKN